MIDPPAWSRDDLDQARQQAEEHFRQSRYTEPRADYLQLFDEYREVVQEVLEETADLTKVDAQALDLLSDDRKREVFRYLSGPPVSEDDLKVLLQAQSISAARLRDHGDLLDRIIAFFHDWHDRRRFPWVGGQTIPGEHDRSAAVLATTALLAMRRLETTRRSQQKARQEDLVAQQLRDAQFDQVDTRTIRTLSDAPSAGQFCRESKLGNRKADFVIGLYDGRTMPLECKVSNSSTNSVKRLNNDAAVKAETWRQDFGTVPILPAAVLSGVYKLHNLEDAQNRGLALFWAHDLGALVEWLRQTQPDASQD